MITKKDYYIFVVFFFFYRFLLIYFDLIELKFNNYTELQLIALNDHFIETLWFYSTLPVGNFLINKITLYFYTILDLKYLYFILNSLYTFFSIILFSKILIKINFKKSIIVIFVILISLLMISYERWQINHHDHINTLIFSLIAYYLFLLIKNNEENILMLSLILLLLVLFSTLSIFLLIGIYIFVIFFFQKPRVLVNSIFVFFLILNIGIHMKNKINFDLFSATTVSSLNLVQKTIHAIGMHNFINLVMKDKKINISIKECHKNIYFENELYPEGGVKIIGQHIYALCFFDFENNRYYYEKISNISNFKNNKKLKKAINDDEFIFNNKKWITQFGYAENNLKTAVYFQSIGPYIFFKAFSKYPYEMLVGQFGAKGFLLTVSKSLSWGSVFPLDYQAENYNWTLFEKIISQLFRIFNMIGLSLSIYYVPKVLKSFFILKKMSKIDIFYLSLIFISSIFIFLLSLILCCENPRLIVMIFFLITIISIINYTKMLKKIKFYK